MLILGIGDHVSCGSALVQDGKLIGALNDERLVREKMVFGVPRESIRFQLEYHGLRPSDIDAVAIGTENQHLIDEYVDFRDGWFGLRRGIFKQTLFNLASNVSQYRSKIPFIESAYYAARAPAFARRRARLKEILREEFDIQAPVTFVDHHRCHISSAYYSSGFRSATAFSVDGGGDGKCASIYDVRDGHFEKLCEIDSYHSLGNFYSYITHLCGFKAGKHEGKITGMAAFGEPQYLDVLRELLEFRDGTFVNTGEIFFGSAIKQLRKRLPPDFSHVDLAASVQLHAEELVTQLVSYWLRRTGQSNVVLAGGVIANVKVNQRIHEVDGVENIFVHPGMADDGIPVGAALTLYHESSGRPYDPEELHAMQDVFLGPEYSDSDIHAALDREGLSYTVPCQIEKEIAALLADSQVVARFTGRMEYGPRSLCHRSVLYRPDDRSVQHWLNNGLRRTEFMPFAPVVREENLARCFKHTEGAEDAARYMTITFDCTDEMIEQCDGVVHVDGTARPQVVTQTGNPEVHRILAEFEQRTGLPALINTSFNMHEEPIVCSPEDAIRAFVDGGIDYLAIGDALVRNPKPVERVMDSTKFDSALQNRG